MIARRGRQSADRATARKIPTSTKKSPQTCAVTVWGLCAVCDFVDATIFVVSRRCTPPGNILLRSTKCSQLKCCARRVLHVQRVWDAAQQVLATQGAVYIQGHCLQGFVRTKALLAAEFFHTIGAGVCRVSKLSHDRSSTGVRARCRVYKLPVAVDLRWKAPCKGTRTLEQSLVCYTSPGGVDSSGFVRGSRLGRCSGWRSK